MKFFFEKHSQPIPSIWIIRGLLMLVVILAVLAGYYHASLVAERKKYLRLEDLYVRVRNELGRETTQQLIDFSREKEISN